MEQLELFTFETFTLEVALGVFWGTYLSAKACARTYMGNRKAWCKSSGHRALKDLTEIEVEQHLETRKTLSGQTRRHDLQLLTLLLNTFWRWKRKGIKVGKWDFKTMELPPQNLLIDIKRPRGNKREHLISKNEWCVIMEHATDKMKERAYFAMDTGLNECDLKNLRVKDYDMRRKGFLVQRMKNRHRNLEKKFIPASKRIQIITLKACLDGKDFILNWSNHQNEWQKIRRLAKLKCQWRDIRKSFGNKILEITGDLTKMKKALMHENLRTTIDWYVIEDGADLRPAIKKIPELYPSY